jgi:homogentisate 1,2-dioxygenase
VPSTPPKPTTVPSGPRATARSAAEEFTPQTWSRLPNLALKPRHLRTHQLDASGDSILGRQHLLANDDCRISYAVAQRPSPLYRNAIGDECVYVEAGSARIESTFGVLSVSAGDYVIIPTSAIHRIVPTDDDPLRTLVIEATGHIGPSRRYLSMRGQLLEHAPYCERDLGGPSSTMIEERTAVEVYVQHRRGWTVFTYAQHPFDVVGWDGCLYPWSLSIHDFEPITGRVHQPPPVHQTFEGPNFVICSFVPRKVDYHPLAIPVPYNHHNVDSDEMLSYTGGNSQARRGSGIVQGSISLHPAGFSHGPQPGAPERVIGADSFDELAVMVDTFRPLDLCEPALACEDVAYASTWATPTPPTPPSPPSPSAVW